MRKTMNEAKHRKMFHRAVATIPDPSLRAMVMAAPHKALFGQPGCCVGYVWLPSGPVPDTDPPIVGPLLDEMIRQLHAGYAVILISNDRRSRDRAVACLQAALDDERPPVVS
jgi:hypothetical protein